MTGGRERLVELAWAKPIPPYSLDEELNFFCPRENLAGLGLPAVRAFHRWLLHEHRPPPGGEGDRHPPGPWSARGRRGRP